MQTWQQIIVTIYGFFSFIGFLKGYHQSKIRKNPFGLTGIFNLIGAFVWGDLIVFGIFWTLVSVAVLLLADWLLFLLTISVFWLIRSLGETTYWLNQQFSGRNRNPPETLLFARIFPGDSIWFVHQIIAQCIVVVSAIFSLYFAKLWLGQF